MSTIPGLSRVTGTQYGKEPRNDAMIALSEKPRPKTRGPYHPSRMSSVLTFLGHLLRRNCAWLLGRRS
jgi:hypothetical protein